MKILAYILSLLGLVCLILASLIKGEKMKKTLILIFVGSIFIGTSYLLDGTGINGAATFFLGAVQTLINYYFDSKDIPIPKLVILLHCLAIIVVNIIVSGGVTPLGMLAACASLIFIFSISQKNGAGYRRIMIINLLMWCVYDYLSAAGGALITHIVLFSFNLIGVIINDIKKKN